METYSRSLFNFTQSPGWTPQESEVLRLCLMLFGVGCWGNILDLGLLPGKTRSQLVIQTQRMLGQQSLAEFNGLQLDIDKIRAMNDARVKEDPTTVMKVGVIVNTGDNLSRADVDKKMEENMVKFGLTEEQIAGIDHEKLFQVKRRKRLAMEERYREQESGREGSDHRPDHEVLISVEGSRIDVRETPEIVLREVLAKKREQLSALTEGWK
eukprot:TRINITY_DN82867_c0_g1_i1.p1 TRINITY_DN82867_c0_g1~~TRINITY_DN82867_c0_g1_i1.p1  ORF type:complete len:247 (-),score=63.56 TRINITY_DN82867_c0_g1_i1:106-738(-)